MAWYRQFDWLLFFSWLGLSLIGLVAIYSATQGSEQGALLSRNFGNQVIHVVLGLAAILIIQFTASRTFIQLAYLAYGLTLVFGILTVFFGVEVGGERNWLSIMGFRLQISEFMKGTTVLALANYLTSRRDISAKEFSTVATIIVIIFAPVMLITLMGDTGTSLVFFALIPFILLWSGLPYGLSLLIVSPAILAYLSIVNWPVALIAAVIIPLVIFLLEKRPGLSFVSFAFSLLVVIGVQVALMEVLQPHQQARVEAFVNPAIDPHGAGWNVIQAKTAIGSGGIYGKGFMEGTQTQLRFLPEQQTDFIFCVISEEFGFIGASLVMVLFLIMLMRILSNAANHRHPFAQLTMVGIVSVILIHIIINLGSATALLPVIGIPLPFLSYGGSSFLSFSIMIGICLNFYYYEKDFSIYAS